MDKESKIYIAGHRGLVGSALLKQLKDAGFDNILTKTHAELDLTNQEETIAFLKRERPDYVFLAAAKVGGIVANNTYPAEFVHQNLMIQSNVIHGAYLAGVKRLLFLGSSCIYPRDCPQPIKEEYLLTGPLEATNRPYAVAKIAGIEMCWSYNRQYRTQFISAMPTNLYGPGDNYHLQNSHVIPALIRKFHLAKLAMRRDYEAIERDESVYGEIPEEMKAELLSVCDGTTSSSVTIWGTGAPLREFLHSEDMASACTYLMSLESGKLSKVLGATEENPPLFNIGYGKDISIKDLAALVRELVGYEGEIVFDSSKPDGTPRKLLDSSKVNSTGWSPSFSLREGIVDAYNNYREKLDY